MKKSGKYKFICRIAGVVCMLAFFSFTLNLSVIASENAPVLSGIAVVSSRTTDDGIYIYIKGVDQITSGTTVQIGNTLCEDIQVAPIASMGMPIRTMILFDNSQSLSQRWGSQSKELMKELIDGHAEGEEFKIATFADSLNVVADFSTEYDLLKIAVDAIPFVNQNSYLTDILYDLLKQNGESGEPNYTRIIIVTDGADDNEIKYTQTELSDVMKNSGVVIHTVGVKASKNNELLEKLFSYARITGGTYAIAEKDTDVKGISETFNLDHSLLCMKLKPVPEVMDGGRKEAKLNLNTSGGTLVLRTSLQMPFADVSSVPSETEQPGASPVPTPAAEKQELPTIAVPTKAEEAPRESGNTVMLPVMAVGAVMLTVIVILVILLIVRGKKPKTERVIDADQGKSGGQSQGKDENGASGQNDILGKTGTGTKRISGKQTEIIIGKTVHLKGGAGQDGERRTYITLADIHNSRRNFETPIDSKIVIGREEGDILLGDDGAVSYMHCEIIKKGKLFYVNDLKSSNGTFYENVRVQKETPIMNGGILKVGSYEYRITIKDKP